MAVWARGRAQVRARAGAGARLEVTVRAALSRLDVLVIGALEGGEPLHQRDVDRLQLPLRLRRLAHVRLELLEPSQQRLDLRGARGGAARRCPALPAGSAARTARHRASGGRRRQRSTIQATGPGAAARRRGRARPGDLTQAAHRRRRSLARVRLQLPRHRRPGRLLPARATRRVRRRRSQRLRRRLCLLLLPRQAGGQGQGHYILTAARRAPRARRRAEGGGNKRTSTR